MNLNRSTFPAATGALMARSVGSRKFISSWRGNVELITELDQAQARRLIEALQSPTGIAQVSGQTDVFDVRTSI